MSLYCLMVELEAIEREWWREVEKSELANEEKVLDCSSATLRCRNKVEHSFCPPLACAALESDGASA